jgi:hypothetical protein
VKRSEDMLRYNTSDLTLTAARGYATNFVNGDVYGDDNPSLVLQSDGTLMSVSGIYCVETSKYHFTYIHWTSDLQIDCGTEDISTLYTDSIVNFPVSDYVSAGSANHVQASSTVSLVSEAIPQSASLCNGCNIVSVQELFKDVNQPLIYPNPASNTLYIEIGKTHAHHILISDMQGRVWINRDLFVSEAIDIQSLPQGLYILTLQDDKAINTRILLQVVREF